MTSTLVISLLCSFTLFLGLSGWARQRIRHAQPGWAELLLLACGIAGLGWMVLRGDFSFTVPAVLIGALGYCFGHFTTTRPPTAQEQPSQAQER